MDFINTILGIPLGFVIYFAYVITSSYGLAILIFAIMVKVIIFPVSLIAHRNSIRLLQIQPALTTIKRRYSGDKERLNEEQYNLFSKARYNPLVGFLPLFIQLFLVMGMLQVMYHPLQHMLRLTPDVIDALTHVIYGAQDMPGGGQLYVLSVFNHPSYADALRAALYGFPNSAEIIHIIQNTDLQFLGLDLGVSPSLRNPSVELLVPLFAGLAALAFCLVQSAISPGALSQGRRTNYGLTVFTVVLSLYFAFVLPVGVGLYWTYGNLFAIGVVIVLYTLYSPRKLAGDAITHIQSTRKTTEQVRNERLKKKALSAREKKDMKRFLSADKHLVFFALSGGQYRYYKDVIDYLLDNSGITIHYLTNDPKDALFKKAPSKLIPYYVGLQKTISLMLKLDADIMVTTVHGLHNYYLKKSIARNDIEYIFMFHGFTSTHMVVREAAYDHYNTVFCVGPHHVAELRRREDLAGLPRRNLVKAGYGLYDQLKAMYSQMPPANHERSRILIAPSWQEDNILESCIEPLLDALVGQGYFITVRPHPQFIKLFPERMDELLEKYASFTDSGEIAFEMDISGSESILSSDILISDWSNIAYEFSFATLKPCIFINTPMKILNPNYEKYGLEVTDITLRDKIGISVDIPEINRMHDIVQQLICNKQEYKERIEEALSKLLFHPGRSGEAGGKYILRQLEKANLNY